MVASALGARVRLYRAAFDGDSTTWVLLRLRLLVASVTGSLAGGRYGTFLALDLVVN